MQTPTRWAQACLILRLARPQDFYQPESIVPISIPCSYYAITLAKLAAGYCCGVGNRCVLVGTRLHDKLTATSTNRAGNLIGWYVHLSDCDQRQALTDLMRPV